MKPNPGFTEKIRSMTLHPRAGKTATLNNWWNSRFFGTSGTGAPPEAGLQRAPHPGDNTRPSACHRQRKASAVPTFMEHRLPHALSEGLRKPPLSNYWYNGVATMIAAGDSMRRRRSVERSFAYNRGTHQGHKARQHRHHPSPTRRRRWFPEVQYDERR